MLADKASKTSRFRAWEDSSVAWLAKHWLHKLGDQSSVPRNRVEKPAVMARALNPSTGEEEEFTGKPAYFNK